MAFSLLRLIHVLQHLQDPAHVARDILHHQRVAGRDRGDASERAEQLSQFRLDVFNAFNVVVINDRNRNVIFRSPTDLTVVNSQYLADGSLDPARATPRNAGFGAATGAQPLRNLQLQIRLGF